jgi:hypothetical protein
MARECSFPYTCVCLHNVCTNCCRHSWCLVYFLLKNQCNHIEDKLIGWYRRVTPGFYFNNPLICFWSNYAYRLNLQKSTTKTLNPSKYWKIFLFCFRKQCMVSNIYKYNRMMKKHCKEMNQFDKIKINCLNYWIDKS